MNSIFAMRRPRCRRRHFLYLVIDAFVCNQNHVKRKMYGMAVPNMTDMHH